jgi:VanZ family protein
VVVIGSLLPGESAPMAALESLRINDKAQHVLAYTALALLPALHERRRALAFIAPGLVALGILLEFGQLFSPGRSFELGDMAADAVGVIAGSLIGMRIGAGWNSARQS